MPATDAGDFRFGRWLAQPSMNRLLSDEGATHLRPRTMDVLVELAIRACSVVSREELIDAIWSGQHVEDEGLTHCIAELRDALGEHARQTEPSDDDRRAGLIETVPKRGYRLNVPVHWMGRLPDSSASRAHGIVVLPVDDLGPDRDESFALGLTEALIAGLAGVPGLRVVSRTSSVYGLPSMDMQAIAGKFNVSHALESSVRRGGARAVISVRLVDARGDWQVWGDTYVEQGGTSLDVQDCVARAVTDAVTAILQRGQVFSRHILHDLAPGAVPAEPGRAKCDAKRPDPEG